MVCTLIFLASVGLAAAAVHATEDSSKPSGPWLGMTLQEALQELQHQGLRLIYTDQLVSPELTVQREPDGSSPQRILLELLAPHGLGVEETTSGRWVVVKALAALGSVRGRIVRRPGDLSEADREPAEPALADVRVELVELRQRITSDASGFFEVLDLEAGAYTLRFRREGFLPREHLIQLGSGQFLELLIELQQIPTSVEQIDVTTEPPGILGSGLSSLTLVQDELEALPHFGDQTLRGLIHLPGTSGSDLSAELNVRGGRADEVMVQLDGLEIFEAYHLPDFGNAFSVFAGETVQRIDLLTGGFPVEYGDRMSGVLDITTIDPHWRRRSYLGFSVYQVRAGQSGTSDAGRLAYVGSLRFGSLELPLRLADEEENPSFADGFFKLDYRVDAKTRWRFNALTSSNHLDFKIIEDDEQEVFKTQYDNLYGWGTHSRVVRDTMFVTTQGALSRIARQRRGLESDDTSGFDLADLRQLTTAGLRHEADWRQGRHFLEWGLEGRHLEVDYDYSNQRQSDVVLALIRDQPVNGVTSFDRRFDGQQYALYVSDRFEVSPSASFEAGLRFDENSITDDHQLSPRLHFTYAINSRSLLRAAWGQYNQSQRVYELPVEDGDTEFSRSERSRHHIVGYERVFGSAEVKRPVTLRVEAYERRINRPRRRYENLFEPIAIVPEVGADRIRVDAESSRAQGLEVFLGGALGSKVEGFVTYTYSRSRDRIAGRWVPRPYDQPHALGIDLSWQAPWQWRIQVAWRYHTGWPTTAIAAQRQDSAGDAESGTVVPVLGELYGERVSHYDRLDLRAQRSWQLKRGSLGVFLDVQNLSNRSNVRGFDIELVDDGEAARVDRTVNTWGGRLPSFGLTWTF